MQLRHATTDDDEFSFTLHERAMRASVEPVYGWDEERQRRYHAEWFEPARLSIVEDDSGRRIGVLDVADEGDHLYLARIEIDPSAQSRGVGSAVVRSLLARGRPIRLHVFPHNVRAQMFYERLGFEIIEDHERPDRVAMWHPGKEPLQ